MTTPQQPEIARSGRSAADPASAKSGAEGPLPTGGPTGPVPEANRAGHHPEKEQDKPEGPPRRTRAPKSAGATGAGRRPAARKGATAKPAAASAATTTATATAKQSATEPATRRFPFAFEPRLRALAGAVGVRPDNAFVEVGDGRLRIGFGRWSLETELANVEGAERTGPYTWFKVAGPPRLSLADRGITFATNTRAGVCIRFREPVPGLLPVGLLQHPGATVTVEDVDGLVDAIAAARG